MENTLWSSHKGNFAKRTRGKHLERSRVGCSGKVDYKNDILIGEFAPVHISFYWEMSEKIARKRNKDIDLVTNCDRVG